MARSRDVSGQKFGLLTALCPTDKRNNGAVVWRFCCDCGTKTEKPLRDVASGKILSCGCIQGRHLDDEEITVGQKFGKLTALCPTSDRTRGHVVWKFQCDCGKISEVPLADVKRGNTRSCGCLRSHKRVDVTGQQFGYLTAICSTDKMHRGCYVWKFRCICGNEIERSVAYVRAGKAKSCGCMRYSGLKNHK